MMPALLLVWVGCERVEGKAHKQGSLRARDRSESTCRCGRAARFCDGSVCSGEALSLRRFLYGTNGAAAVGVCGQWWYSLIMINGGCRYEGACSPPSTSSK